ncbi:MAG TPA: hypothetical protein VLI45_04800 [Acidobacteriaceae bacterium]|nr:hypothetical protein [Acidobacteriaceae bacterium]
MPTYPDLTGNWQIQSGTPPNSPPTALLLLGALQSSGDTVNGTFRFTNLAQPTTCALNQVVALSGRVDSSGNLTLTSAPLPNGTTVKVQLAVPEVRTSSATGTIEVSGDTCAVASNEAIGVQVASVTGTYAGTLTPGTLLSPGSGPIGSATFSLAQAVTPAADGQFPVTGTFSYVFGACSKSVAVTGTASGVGIMLSASTTPETGPYLTIVSTTIPAATQITVGSLASAPALCSSDPLSTSSFSGTLLRQ